ncbi:MAG: hypothetical protein AAGI92_11025 [Pseudomonadota bacterium]
MTTTGVTKYAVPVSLLFASLTLVSGHANTDDLAGVSYTCDVAISETDAFLDEVLIIAHDLERNQIAVSEPVIEYFDARGYVDGWVATTEGAFVEYAWEFMARDGDGTEALMQYSAELSNDDLTVIVRASPQGYDEVYRAMGNCTAEAVDF